MMTGPSLTVGLLTPRTMLIDSGDDESRRKFRVYWFFVRPFSGLIRRLTLRAVKRACWKTH